MIGIVDYAHTCSISIESTLLEYMPLRVSFTFYQPQKNNFISQNISLGIEVLFSKYFNILVGYNHRNNKSFKLNNDKLRGLSYGLELTLKRINLKE